MGSRMMHLLIADRVSTNRGRMLLGSIAPDGDEIKGETHFKGTRYTLSDGAPSEYGRFIAKYHEKFTDPYYIGYLTHLVADDMWATFMYYSGLKDRLRNEPNFYKELHKDFYLCNAKLAEKYVSDGLYEALNLSDDVPKLTEIDKESVMRIKHQALGDFKYPSENISEPLTIVTVDGICAYIERAARRSLDVCYPWLKTISNVKSVILIPVYF
ncbi:hypothetical protein [Paenibacillus agricola]|uniref:Zinc dependent phospholipase C n=1 Tax=Paenibacillus agricola TaxID=2716264 RepID=A0ABX0JKU4_9BACL|nr:hypothetical protein [Paenibacillus agricola]NHN34721.1 hypothetical protein [Paenibacillus agricola]